MSRWNVRQPTRRRRDSIAISALILSLVAGAYLTAAGTVSPDHPYLLCLTVFPLFVAILTCGPFGAALSGGLWGIAVYVFSAVIFGHDVTAGPWSGVVLACVPALFAMVGSHLTRRIGFSPFVLGAGWMIVELVLSPLGLREGLLANAQGGGSLIHWLAGALGYALAASAAASLGALLVLIVSGVRLGGQISCYLSSSGPVASRLWPQTYACLPLYAIHASRPRGPPIGAILPS